MLSLDLDAGGRTAYEAALCGTYRLRVTVLLLDLDGEELADLSGDLLDGQVNLDLDADTTRQASIQLDDPTHSLHVDSAGPAEGSLFADRMIRVLYGVRVDDRWVDVPVFTGPIAGLARDGDTVDLSCLGKEHLARGHAWSSTTYKKGAKVLDTIRAILRDRAGETSFDFPTDTALVKKTLKDDLSLSRLSVPWDVARQLAGAVNASLYYDGRGRCVLDTDSSLAWKFKDGDGGSVLSPPQVAYDLSSLVNAVHVKGGKGSGTGKAKRPAPQANAVARRAHPLSPWSLGRTVGTGEAKRTVPRYLAVEVNNDKLKTKADVQETADRTLAAALDQALTVSFDAFPIPHLDPGDRCRVSVTGTTALDFTLRQASLPLVHSGVMSVGSVKRVVPNRAKIRGS